MDRWASLSEIVQEFNLAEGSSFEQVRMELLNRIKKLHPDQTKGEFPDAETETAYYKTLSAYQRLEQIQHASMSLVPYEERPVAHWAPPKVDLREDETQMRKVISEAASLKYRQTKIRSAVIAVAITTTLVFSGRLVENPVISNLLSYLDAHIPVFRPIIEGAFLFGILAACAAFFAAWKREILAKTLSEDMLTEVKLQDIFTVRMKSSISDDGVFLFNNVVDAVRLEADFTKRGWVDWAPPKLTSKLPFSWRYKRVRGLFESDSALAQQAAELIIAKLESRQAITPVAAGALSREYQLSEVALSRLKAKTEKSAKNRS